MYINKGSLRLSLNVELRRVQGCSTLDCSYNEIPRRLLALLLTLTVVIYSSSPLSSWPAYLSGLLTKLAKQLQQGLYILFAGLIRYNGFK